MDAIITDSHSYILIHQMRGKWDGSSFRWFLAYKVLPATLRSIVTVAPLPDAEPPSSSRTGSGKWDSDNWLAQGHTANKCWMRTCDSKHADFPTLLRVHKWPFANHDHQRLKATRCGGKHNSQTSQDQGRGIWVFSSVWRDDFTKRPLRFLSRVLRFWDHFGELPKSLCTLGYSLCLCMESP